MGREPMHGPLARHLARFTSQRPAAWPLRDFGDSAPASRPSARPAGAASDPPGAAAWGTSEEIEARVAAARAEGAAAAEAAAELRLAGRLREIEHERAASLGSEAARRQAETEAAVEAALALARDEWAASGAAALAQRLDEGLAELRGRLASALADALRPLLSEAAASRALAAFVAALDQLLADPARPAVLVRGPAALVEALRAVRGDAAGVTFEAAADAVEVVLTADGAHVETRLAAALLALAADPAPVATEREAPR